MAIEVIKPGLATTIQDAGRPGYYNIGIPLSGALDQYALRVANLLVGNEESAAVLEATLLAPELVFRAPAIVAIAGAEATPKINGEPRPRNESSPLPSPSSGTGVVCCQSGRSPHLRFHKIRSAELHCSRWWHRCPCRVGQSVALRPRSAGRIRRPQACRQLRAATR